MIVGVARNKIEEMKSNFITTMYIIKQNYFSENKVFPYISIKNFNTNLIQRARIRAKNNHQGSHPWENMSDMEILKNVGLYRKDITIQNAIPYNKVRKVNMDRYDG
jgi:hypothetical protein